MSGKLVFELSRGPRGKRGPKKTPPGTLKPAAVIQAMMLSILREPWRVIARKLRDDGHTRRPWEPNRLKLQVNKQWNELFPDTSTPPPLDKTKETQMGPTCQGCGKALDPRNYRIADGCPCNTPRGINHGVVPKDTCTCGECDPAQTGSTRYPPEPEPHQ